MAYLIAKFALLLLLACALGAILGYWWCRRQFVDVTESHHSLLTAHDDAKAQWSLLSQRLDQLDAGIEPTVRSVMTELPAPPDVDLQPILNSVGRVGDQVGAIKIPEPEPVDLTMFEGSLAELKGMVASIRIPGPETVDLSALQRGFEELKAQVAAIHVPESAPVDLDPVLSSLGRVADQIGALDLPIERLDQRVAAISIPKVPDGLAKESSLSELASAVSALPKASADVGLQPVLKSLAELSSQIDRLPISDAPPATDLSPIMQLLSAMESEVQTLPDRFICKGGPTAAPPAPPSGPRLFTQAEMGPADDLKKISGVGPKLEKLLNANGVFYFWQVASWSRDDIQFIDDRLEVFQGRISRDDWVPQARSLMSDPAAAKQR